MGQRRMGGAKRYPSPWPDGFRKLNPSYENTSAQERTGKKRPARGGPMGLHEESGGKSVAA